MTTKVVKVDNKIRMITGKLAPYLDLAWEDYTLTELQGLLANVIRFEIEHNLRRHKDYIELRVTSLKDELLVIHESEFGA